MKHPIKILFLEDSPTDAEIVKRVLQKEKLNFESLLATDKESFLLGLDEFIPDIILSDHSLPQFDSASALAIARKKFPDIPFIMVTGAVSEEFAADIIKSGADDYVLKDRLSRLSLAIETALKKRQAEKEKSEAEKKIIQSETNLRAIFENTSEGFLLMDHNAVVKAFNSKAGEYTFINRLSDIEIGHSIFEYVEDSRKDFFREMVEKALRGEKIQYERFYERAHGEATWIDFSLTPVIEAGEVNGICITGRDITERKKAEDKIRFNAELLNTVGQAVIATDINGLIIYWNNAAEKIYGWSAEEAMGKNINDVTPVQQNKEEAEEIMKELAEGNIWNGEFLVQRKDGTVFPAFVTDSPIYNDKKEVIGVIGVSVDISERKKTEKELTDYKNALDQSAIVSITNPKGIIIYVNENFCTISGYSAEELLEQDHRIINSGYHPKSYIKDLWATIAKGNIWRGEFCNRAKDGSPYWVDATIVPFLNNQGNPVQYLAIRIDITAKKMLEKEILNQKIQEQRKIARAIIQAQEKERNFLGQELHDNINQILAGTKLYLAYAVQQNKELEGLIKYPLELIDSSIEEIRILCRKLVTPVRNINLQVLVAELLSKFDKTIFEKKEFTYIISDDLLSDDLKLNIYRIIQEQLSNIVKYAGSKSVSISVMEKGKTIDIIIADEGKGFDTKKARNGIGISNMINRVECFNGEIEIESSPGNGCRIQISIPY